MRMRGQLCALTVYLALSVAACTSAACTSAWCLLSLLFSSLAIVLSSTDGRRAEDLGSGISSARHIVGV